jgi:hypothetical protein
MTPDRAGANARQAGMGKTPHGESVRSHGSFVAWIE